MPGPGRNEPCPCGSGRKTKRCCGQQRGPSEEQLARAHLALLAREASADLAGLSERALDHLWENLIDLPGIDLSLLVTLPQADRPRPPTPARSDRQTTTPTGAGTRSPPSHNRSTPHNNEPRSPTRSSAYATNTASTAAKPPTRSSTSQPLHPLHRRQPPPSRRRLSRRRTHPRRPPPRRLNPPRLSGASSQLPGADRHDREHPGADPYAADRPKVKQSGAFGASARCLASIGTPIGDDAARSLRRSMWPR